MKRCLIFFALMTLLGAFAAKAHCATYYVATNGNNSNPGTLEKPWATLQYAHGKIKAGTSAQYRGDTVIVRGGTYAQFLPMITKAWTTWKAYPGEKVILDGRFTMPKDGSVQDYTAMLGISAPGVTAEGFQVKNSTGTGIKIWGAGTNNVVVKNCSADNVYYGALQISNSASNVLVEDCDFSRGAKVVQEKCSYNVAYCRSSGWGDPATAVTTSVSSITLRRVVVRDSYNEGLDIDRYSKNITLEYSQIYGNEKMQLYLCAATDNIIRYNLIYGTKPNLNGRDAAKGPGIYVNTEPQWKTNSGRDQIYGNLLANNGTNILFGEMGSPNYLVKDCKIYNNTFVHPTGTWNVVFPGNIGSGHLFKNNIVWGSGTNGLAYAINGKVTADHNLWSSIPYPNLRGVNDPKYADPRLSKTSGWNSLRSGDLTGAEFALQSGSPAITAGGIDANRPQKLVQCSQSNWKNRLFRLVDLGSGRLIGADAYTSSSTTTGLLPPSDLKVSEAP